MSCSTALRAYVKGWTERNQYLELYTYTLLCHVEFSPKSAFSRMRIFRGIIPKASRTLEVE